MSLKGIREPEETVQALLAGFGGGADRLFSLLWDVLDGQVTEVLTVLEDVGIPEHVRNAVQERLRTWAGTHFNPANLP